MLKLNNDFQNGFYVMYGKNIRTVHNIPGYREKPDEISLRKVQHLYRSMLNHGLDGWTFVRLKRGV